MKNALKFLTIATLLSTGFVGHAQVADTDPVTDPSTDPGVDPVTDPTTDPNVDPTVAPVVDADPNAGWVEVPFVLETAHPYAMTGDYIPFKIEGARKMKFVLSRISLESNYDFFVLYDGNGRQLERITGQRTNYTTAEVTGDYAVLQLTTDSSGVDWGFQVSKILVQY